MTNEKEIRSAIATLQLAIANRMLYGPENWDKKKNLLSQIVIRADGVHLVSYNPDGGRDIGNGYSEGSTDITQYPITLIVEDPSVAIKTERDAATAELAKIQSDLESTAKKKADAQKRLDDINNRLLASIK